MENTKLRFTLVIPTGAAIPVTDEATETLPVVADKINKVL